MATRRRPTGIAIVGPVPARACASWRPVASSRARHSIGTLFQPPRPPRRGTPQRHRDPMDSDEHKLDTDEITAHLDRGWDLVQSGDLARAEVAAENVLALDAESPEAFTLLGGIAAAKGEFEEALDHYRKATELDPEFVDPLLYAAEARLADGGNIDEALRLCDQALEVAEEEEDYLDALLLKSEALLQKGDLEAASETLEDLPPQDLPEAAYHLRAGRVLLETGDLDRAEEHLRRALARAPDLTDALHALGVLHEERGDAEKMVAANLQVRQADLKEPAPPWGIPQARFEALAEEALAELPEKLRKLLENVPVVAADYPAIELVSDGGDPRMMGFFAGVPYPEKASVGGLPHLDCVYLYQRNIERYARSTVEVEDEIRKTLIHETGHFFGLSEEELEALGLG
ncbi:MAG: tetratricopeptide repeat protein [Myxococcales bacterium]|nr:tetratricopeptide repeat protein [Myxococcales bacterium]